MFKSETAELNHQIQRDETYIFEKRAIEMPFLESFTAVGLFRTIGNGD